MALSSKMGVSPPFIQFGSTAGSLAGTTFLLDANFVNATSGKGFATRFSAPVSQTSAALTVYAFLTTKAASPTDIKCAIFSGPSGAMDAQRPDTGAALATSAAVDVSAQTNSTWTTFSISSVSLTAGLTYWLVIFNDTATPGTNTATYLTRGLTGNQGNSARFSAFTTADGFTTDPTNVSSLSESPVVLKFGDADSTLLGNPYVLANAHASNTNDRGIRITLDATTNVAGLFIGLTAITNATSFKVYQGSSEVASATTDLSIRANGGTIYFDAPLVMTGGLAYDFVMKISANSTYGTRIDAGASPPADVTNALASGISYVDGATPGSYTSSSGIMAMFLVLDNIPAASGASYTGMMLT